MRKTALATALAASSVLGATGLADASPPAQSTAAKRVTVGDNFFKARSTSVRPRGLVTWVWRGVQDHNVFFVKVPRGAKKPKRCGTVDSGKCTRRLPRKRGTYSYVCTLHGGMTGKIRVR